MGFRPLRPSVPELLPICARRSGDQRIGQQLRMHAVERNFCSQADQARNSGVIPRWNW